MKENETAVAAMVRELAPLGHKIVVLSGPTGVGKDTIAEACARLKPTFKYHLATTSREPRPGEHGVRYTFESVEAFERNLRDGLYLFWTTSGPDAHGSERYYGVLKARLA